MKQRFIVLILVVSALFTGGALAHPLGNFSVNQYARLEVGASQIKLREVLDMAEIPTFQESATIDADRDGKLSQAEIDAYASQLTPGYSANLQVNVNGRSVPVRAVSTVATLGSGAGDMPILRINWDMIADLPPLDGVGRVSFRNNNYPERTGWNEIVIKEANGINIFNTTSFGNGITDELKNYPQEAVTAPLNERSAEFSFAQGPMPENAQPLRDRDGRASAWVQKDQFAQLISVPEITPMVALFGLLAAFGLGAMHAMSPGHGKTVVGAYLVGSRGTARHAVFLGLTVTITHTLGVFALGFITLFASNYILPERLMPFLSFVSGLLVFFIGISLFKDRLFSLLGWGGSVVHTHADHHHDDVEGHITHSHNGVTHTHGGSTHTHDVPKDLTWRSLLALGISGGLLPCPSALVLMLSAISLGRVGYGLVLTVVFSLGLAATLTSIGLVFLYVGSAFGKGSISNSKIVKVVPVFSAFVVAFVGAVICYNSLGPL
jgi:ABC-type nickel/cobalt efflux system permease component RcnA